MTTLVGFSSDSASPTDTFIVNYLNPTTVTLPSYNKIKNNTVRFSGNTHCNIIISGNVRTVSHSNPTRHIYLDDSASSVNNYYINNIIEIDGHRHVINEYDGTSKKVMLLSDFPTKIKTNSHYTIFQKNYNIQLYQNQINLGAAASDTDDEYVNHTININNEIRTIIEYDGYSKIALVDEDFTDIIKPRTAYTISYPTPIYAKTDEPIMKYGTIQNIESISATESEIILDDKAHDIDDEYKYHFIEIKGIRIKINSYDGSTKKVIINSDKIPANLTINLRKDVYNIIYNLNKNQVCVKQNNYINEIHDIYRNHDIQIGTEIRKIIQYDGEYGIATVDRDFPVVIPVNTTYIISYPNIKEYDNSINITTNKIFYKVFINPDSITDNTYNKIHLLSGEYEFKFYKDVIKPLLDNKISPHFVRYYNIYENMTISNYLNFININSKNNRIDIYNIYRNIWFMYNRRKNRPALTDNSINSSINYVDINNFMKTVGLDLTFNLIGLMPMENNPPNSTTQKLSNYLKENFTDIIDNHILSSPNSPLIFDFNDMYIILFELLQACYSLFKSGSVHNDLHSGNIWITSRSNNKQNIKYVITEDNNTKTYNIKTNICVRIYDFDRSYSAKLGDNPINSYNDDNLCKKYSSCNKVIKFMDFAKIICYVFKNFIDYQKHLTEKRITNNINDFLTSINEFRHFYTDDSTCFLLKNGKTPDSQIYDKFDYIQVFDTLYNNITSKFKEGVEQVTNTYECPANETFIDMP